MELPAEFQGASDERIAELGLPIFLHPMMINNERMKQFYLVNICADRAETFKHKLHFLLVRDRTQTF